MQHIFRKCHAVSQWEITLSNHSRNVSRRRHCLKRQASEFPSFLLYLYDDLIDALRHFSRAYKNPCPAKTEGTFPSKMIVAHLMIGFGEEIIAELKTCPLARSLQTYLTTRFASSSAPLSPLGDRMSLQGDRSLTGARLKCPPAFYRWVDPQKCGNHNQLGITINWESRSIGNRDQLEIAIN